MLSACMCVIDKKLVVSEYNANRRIVMKEWESVWFLMDDGVVQLLYEKKERGLFNK